MKNIGLVAVFVCLAVVSTSLMQAQRTGQLDPGVIPQHPKDITGSGKVFLEGCSSIEKPAKQLNSYETHSNVQCLSYVDGIFESMSLADNLHQGPHGFCPPEQPVQRKELVQIVRKYIGEHPETSNERTVILVWLALSQAFSCNAA